MFASYVSRGQSKPRLVFSRINGPNEARTNASEKITETLSVGENDNEIAQTQVNDAAKFNALLNLSELKNPK